MDYIIAAWFIGCGIITLIGPEWLHDFYRWTEAVGTANRPEDIELKYTSKKSRYCLGASFIILGLSALYFDIGL